MTTDNHGGQTPQPQPQPQVRSGIPWVERYRPSTLTEIMHHERILRILKHFLSNNSASFPHLFFYGPPGTGKTSTILSCAREIYGTARNMMVLHLNASDERGVDVVRRQIIQFASTSNMFCCNGGHKLIILDEADSMTTDAQIALRDTIMKYTARFCLIGNFQYSLIPSLQSRVVKMLFTPIPQTAAIHVATRILHKEHIPHDLAALEEIYVFTGGDLRKYLNTLQALSFQLAPNQTMTAEYICTKLHKCSDTVIQVVIGMLDTHTIHEVYYHLSNLMLQLSYDIQTIMNSILMFYVERLKDNMALLSQFCVELAELEFNGSFSVHRDVLLFCIVACLHKFHHKTHTNTNNNNNTLNLHLKV